MGIDPAGLPTLNPEGQNEQPLLFSLCGGALGDMIEGTACHGKQELLDAAAQVENE